MSVVSDGFITTSTVPLTTTVTYDVTKTTVITTTTTTTVNVTVTPVDHTVSFEATTAHYRRTTRKRAAAGSNSKSLPVQIVYGVISCVSVAVLIIMLYMGIFGQRMRWTAQRWHVINCCLWGILHLISYASFADKAPWPNYITNANWKATSTEVEAFTRSVFPAGMIFVFFEAILLTIAPQLANSLIFNLIVFLLMVPVLNVVMILCYFAYYLDYDWYYQPIFLFNMGATVIFFVMIFVYFFFCFVGMCMCCSTIRTTSKTYRNMGTYADMWMLIPYAAVPAIMYIPSFGTEVTSFVLAKLLSWVLSSGLLDIASDASSATGLLQYINFSLVTQVMTDALLAMPWFLLLFPITQACLGFVCLRMWREQLFFSLTCGRLFDGVREKIQAYAYNDISVPTGVTTTTTTTAAKTA